MKVKLRQRISKAASHWEMSGLPRFRTRAGHDRRLSQAVTQEKGSHPTPHSTGQ